MIVTFYITLYIFPLSPNPEAPNDGSIIEKYNLFYSKLGTDFTNAVFILQVSEYQQYQDAGADEEYDEYGEEDYDRE